MILQSLFPVFALVVLGAVLKHFGMTNDRFLRVSDRLVYFIFFPALLFWKIGAAPPPSGVTWNLCKVGMTGVLAVWLLSTAFIRLLPIPAFKAGSFSQSCYRFNTYIGMAVVINALGEEGVRHFGVLIGFTIPLINILAVSVLIWHSGQRYSLSGRMAVTVRALISNPLIIACAAGIAYARTIHAFPPFIENTLRLMSSVTLPLALLSIGGALTLRGLRGNLGLSLAAAVFKLALFPAIGYGLLQWWEVTGPAFGTGMIFFALPTSTAIYVLSSQLNSDTELASASIVVSTVLSFVSLSAVLLLFVSP
ncbi:MAG: AEC family transporter [Desulfobacterales bacterium]|nr:AEC family transporter [Desulfobacterales bacterium]